MEIQQSWRFSYKNAAIALTILNALLLLLGFPFSASTRCKLSLNHSDAVAVNLKNMKESEDMRLAMQPLELIRRVREIRQESYAEPDANEQKEAKQTAALDLSKRLKDFRSSNDAANVRALEEWLIRKMERARRRELERYGTAASQA